MRRMEEDRLCQLRNLAAQYHQIMSENRPKLVSSSKRLSEPIQLCDISRDMEAVKKKVSPTRFLQNIYQNIILNLNVIIRKQLIDSFFVKLYKFA